MKRLIWICGIAGMLFSCGSKKAVVKRNENQAKESHLVRIVEKQKTTTSNAEQSAAEYERRNNIPYALKIDQYILQYAPIAKNEMKSYGVPASITLAQGILESGAGYGKLTLKSRNHFGIKCHNWVGERVYHDDDRSQECFRKYTNVEDSFRDHSLFLANRKRYAALFRLDKKNYKQWAKGLKEAGYATDPKYPKKLIGIIERYQLDRFDREVLGERSTFNRLERSSIEKTLENVIPEDQSITVGNEKTYQVKPQDTLYSISRRYNLTVKELKSLNNLSSNLIKIGQILQVRAED